MEMLLSVSLTPISVNVVLMRKFDMVYSKQIRPLHERQRHFSVHLLCLHQTALADRSCVSQTHGGKRHTYCCVCDLYGVPSYQLQLPADNHYLLNILPVSLLTVSMSTADYGMHVTVGSVVLAF